MELAPDGGPLNPGPSVGETCEGCSSNQGFYRYESTWLCKACWNEHTTNLGLRNGDNDNPEWIAKQKRLVSERDRAVRERNRQ